MPIPPFSSAPTPDATSSRKGKLQLAGDLGGTAASPVVKPRAVTLVIANVGGDYTVNSSTDVSGTLTTAIAALTSSRTSVETVLLRGNFLIDNYVTVPSYTRIIVDGTITTTTLRPSGTTNWSNNMGVFELGDRTTKPITTQAWVAFTPGSKIIGDYFNSSASGYPQDKVNSAAAGFSDSTLLNQKDVCGVHSYCTLIDSGTVNVTVENMHGGVRLETLGRTNGTPSKGVLVDGTRTRYTIVGIEVYCNGYQSDSVVIKNTYAEYCLDDIVAVVGSDGGTSGANGIMKGVTILGVAGNKNGLRGSAVKLDGGSMLSGTGQVRDITVTSVNVTTTQATLSGVTPSENVTYLVLMGNTASRNIHYNNVRGPGNWLYGIRTDTSGVDLSFQGFYAECKFGCILKCPNVPSDVQKVTLTDCSLKERNYSSAETGSRGVAVMGGASPQGFKNIILRNVRLLGFEKPLVERGITGLGSDGTITNVDYDIDIMDKATTDLDLTSTNRRMTIRRLGQLVQQENGSVTIQNVADPINAQDAMTKNASDANYQPKDATLTALAALDSTTGMLVETAVDTFARRTITGTTNQVVVANGDGVSGNPTLSLPQSVDTAATPTFAQHIVGSTISFSSLAEYFASFATGNLDIAARGSVHLYLDSNNNGTTDTFQVFNNGNTTVVFQIAADGGHITPADGANMVMGTSTGTKFGTATNQKIGFFNATPVIQQTGDILTALSNLGLVGSPKVSKRTGTTTSSATPTINTDNVEYYELTAQAVDITSFTTNLSGTPTNAQTLWISITGTASRAITWGTSFEASTVALPTTTSSTSRLDVGFIWNAATSKWRCVAVA